MARSQLMYIVLNGSTPVAGFTVKHELIAWLKRNPLFIGDKVWRVPDGASGRVPVEITEELE